MKKIILFSVILFVPGSFIYSQSAREAELPKEKTTKKLPVSLNKDFRVTASALNESFEGVEFPPPGWTDFVDGGSGWSRESAGTPLPGWITDKVITTPPNGGSFVAYCTWNGDNTYNDQWLVTPLIQNIQPNDRIYFWLRKQLGYPDTVYIYYSLDGSNFDQMGHVAYPLNSDTNWGLWYSRIGSKVPAGSNAYVGFEEYVEDNSINGAAISMDLIYTVSYPVNISLNKTFAFGDPAQQTNYRMIGVPGNVNIPVGPLMNGEQKKDWNVFYDDGSEPADLLEFNGQATFNFRPGKGFWALSRNPIIIPQQEVSSVILNTDNSFQLNLNPGWNIISNPFERSVNWDEVRNINIGVNQPLFDFNGGYSPVLTMETYKGYYFYNQDNRGNIFIPYNPGGALGKNKTSEGGGINSADLKISLIVDEQKRSEVFLSMNPDSKNESDKHDIFAPPSNFEEANLSLFNPLLPSYKYLMVDSRSEVGNGQIYELEVKNLSGESASLNFKGINNFEDNEIYLFDSRFKKSYNIKFKDNIELIATHQHYDFQLLIGSRSFIDEMKISQTPVEFKLYRNYPNPFNPSTIIMFDLPRNQNINLFIYNILGEKLKTLYSGNLEAGRYEYMWNGTNEFNQNLPSGVYIYSLEGPEIRLAQKMILNR